MTHTSGGVDLPAEGAARVGDVLGAGVRAVGRGDEPEDLLVRLAVGRHGEAEPGVRTVDEAVPSGGEERTHERHAVPGDGAVPHARHVALGRRGVEHDGAAVVGQGDPAGLVDVDLGPTDLHEARLVEAR